MRHGGIGIQDPSKMAQWDYEASQRITAEMIEKILQQEIDFVPSNELLRDRVKEIENLKEEMHVETLRKIVADPETPQYAKKNLELAQEKGSGAWLTTVPVQAMGYALNKDEFRAGICLRYGWRIKNMPQHCACGTKNDIDHALCCKLGGNTIFRHNRVRDTIAELLKEVTTDVITEPPLAPLESSNYRQDATRGNKSDAARLDIACMGIYSPLERTYMDVRIFHAGAPSYRNKTLTQLYQEHERSKKSEYNARIVNVEKGSFVPLIFSTAGGLGQEARKFTKRLAGLISVKTGEKYSHVKSHITTRIRIALLKSVLVSVRGSRTKNKEHTLPPGQIPFGLVASDEFIG